MDLLHSIVSLELSVGKLVHLYLFAKATWFETATSLGYYTENKYINKQIAEKVNQVLNANSKKESFNVKKRGNENGKRKWRKTRGEPKGHR